MTEKRFSVEVESLKKQKYYRLHDENGRGLNSTEAVLLLNYLVNENEQLKSDLQKLQDSLWTTEKIRELEKENEQLKSDNKCYVKRYSELFDDYIAYKKENEQLKQSNKDAWDLIRFIYNEIKEDGSMDLSRIKDLVEFYGDVE